MSLTSTRPERDYNCTQAELYAALKLAWNSFAKYESDFISDNNTYTTGMAAGKKDSIRAADELPDGQQRTAHVQVLSNTLLDKSEKALAKWNTLESCIAKAFKGINYKPRVEEAGKLYYKKAANKNWEHAKELMTKGNSFISNHTSELTTGGGMPTGFDTAFATAKTEFESTYDDFMDARETAQEETDAKINANNAIYADGTGMLKDGKRIFKKNAVVRKRFTWSKILQLVTLDGATKIIVDVTVGAGAVANFDLTGETFEADKITGIKMGAKNSDGKFYCSNSPTGLPGSLFILVATNTSESRAAQDAQTELGLSSTNTLFNVQNTGTQSGVYTLTITVGK